MAKNYIVLSKDLKKQMNHRSIIKAIKSVYKICIKQSCLSFFLEFLKDSYKSIRTEILNVRHHRWIPSVMLHKIIVFEIHDQCVYR